MKFVFLILLISTQTFAINSFSQERIDLDLKDKTITAVLKTIERKYTYRFFYSDSVALAKPKVDIYARNATIDYVMQQLLEATPFSYKKMDKGSVVIIGNPVNETTFPVSGIVTNEKDEPIRGASIIEKGTNNGTSTGIDGRFSFNVKDKKAVLIISVIGYGVKEIPVSASSLKIQLELLDSSLNEVIVIGYGTQKKSDLTGSIAKVSEEDLNQGRNTDVLSALNGKAAGVQIFSQSGELGSGFNIKIRGANSINSLTSPLYVVDGVPFDTYSEEIAGTSEPSSTTPNPLTNINPQDIASIEILKDASATAIYGSRGANGVVLITTKSGKPGKTLVAYDGNLRFNSISKKLDVLDPQEYLNYRIQRFGDSDDLVLQMDPDKDGTLDIPGHNWQDEIYKNSLSQSHTVTVSGGSKETQFSGSLSFLDDQGIIISNENKRYTARARIDQSISSKVKIGININFANNVLTGATNSGGSFQGVSRTALFSRPVELYSPSDASDGFDVYISPVANIASAQRGSNTTRTIGNAYLNYKIANGLTLNIMGGGNISDSKGKEFYPANTTSGVKTNGAAAIQNIHSLNWTNTNQLTYNKKFGESALNVVGVFEVSSYRYERNSVASQNFVFPNNGADNIGTGATIVENSSYKYINNRYSLLGRVFYSLKDRYLFTVSIRDDASDKFGSNNRHGYFPSGAFAWKVSSENFMANQQVFSNLKLRLSYGVTGNDKIDPYTYLALLEPAYYGGAGGSNYLGLAPANPGNPNLRWERNIEYDAGIDIGLFKERISITADYYNRKVDQQLLEAPLATQGGYYAQFKNLGRIDNYGYELAIHSQNVKRPNFSWHTDINLSFDRSKVVSLGGADIIPVTVGGDISLVGALIVGQPFGTGYGYIMDGVYQVSDFDLNGDTYTLKEGLPVYSGGIVQPGSYKFRDINGPGGVPDGVIDSYDQTVISNSSPKFSGGINNVFSYKNIDFSFFLQGVQGRDIINEIKLDMTGWKANRNLGTDFFYNRWTPENPTNEYGTWSDQNVAARTSNTFYVEDGSFLRLKTVSLGYSLPAGWLSHSRMIKKLRIYVTGNDLITWTKYTGYDPEVSFRNPLITGLDQLVFPRTRSVIVGLTANF